MTWSSFLRSAHACSHAVHVYGNPAELAGSVRSYLDAGFSRGDPAIVIAGPELARGLEGPVGLLTVLDADATLASFMEGDWPSPERFEEVVGGVVDEVASRFPGRTIRAFGEMVDVLWQRGEKEAALELEQLWNDLARTRAFALLCAYKLDLFDLEVQQTALPAIMDAHTHVRPGDPARLATAVDRAVAETLGPNGLAHVYLEVAEHVPLGSLPRSQAVLSWLAKHSPDVARRLLPRARALYAETR